MRFAVMIEGQEDVTWERLARARRDLRAAGVRGAASAPTTTARSTATPRPRLARRVVDDLRAGGDRRRTLRLGTLVSPATFRHPSVLAKSAVTADHISGGRIELGIGTGWHEAEHRAYGFPFPPMKARMDRLAEQLEIIAGSWAPGPVLVRRRALRGRGPRRAAQAGPGPAAAADGRRGGARAARRSPRASRPSTTSSTQTPEEAGGGARADRRRVRGGRPRPGDDDASRSCTGS